MGATVLPIHFKELFSQVLGANSENNILHWELLCKSAKKLLQPQKYSRQS